MPETAITFDDVLLIPAYNHHESRRIVEIGMTDKSGKLTLGPAHHDGQYGYRHGRRHG